MTLRGSGSTRSISGTGFQSALGLRSSWFSIAVLSLTGGGTVEPGKPRVLHGVARGVKSVWLERRIGSKAWTRVRDLTPGADRRFTHDRAPAGHDLVPARLAQGQGRRRAGDGLQVRRAAAVLAGLAAATVLASPAGAASGELSVQVADGADAAQLERSVAAATGGRLVANLRALDTLVFSVDELDADSARAARLAGVRSVERLTATRRLAFEPNDPLAPRQWYLGAIRAFDFWPDAPLQPPVRVAIVDSGVDGGHPELAGRIVGSRSFVSSPALVDTDRPRTIIAGQIAATIGNARGTAGVGIPVELLVAKVVASNGSISIVDEASAIRWAVDSGAQVINLSLGGPRDPRAPTPRHVLAARALGDRLRDEAAASSSSPPPGTARRSAARSAMRAGPAALPHVIGVGALNPSNGTPDFSNRDRAFVDLAAPGVQIFSTFPRGQSRTGCALRGYTSCARSSAPATRAARRSRRLLWPPPRPS